MMNKFLSRTVVFILLSLSSAFSTTLSSEKLKKLTLTLNWKPEPEFGGFYVAKEKGLYQKENLEVSIVPGGSGTPSVQMVVAGQTEFGIASADEVVIARSKGADIVALFAIYQTNPQGIMTHESPQIKELKDIFSRGGILAIQKGLGYSLFLEKKYGFSKVKVVPYAGGISQFLTDHTLSQQCFVTAEPVTARKSGARPKVFLVSDVGYNPYTTVVVTRKSYLEKNGDTVRSFLKATQQGWKQYLENPTDANRLMNKLNPSMDIETFSESAKIQMPLIETAQTKKSGLGVMTEERWKQLADQLLDLKLIEKKGLPSDYFQWMKLSEH